MARVACAQKTTTRAVREVRILSHLLKFERSNFNPGNFIKMIL